MPQISEKGMAMPSSPIRKLVPFADKAKERGIKVYHLNIGQPDIQTPDVALQALKTCNEKVIEYTHSAGNISYRKKLAKYYQNIGINIDENNIMITTGGSEAITIAFMSTLNPGDEIIIPEPFYANYTAFALMCGVLAGVLTWVAGPSKGIFAVGKAGYLPPFFQKTNKIGVQKNILIIQGCIVTLLALLFVVMPSVRSEERRVG